MNAARPRAAGVPASGTRARRGPDDAGCQWSPIAPGEWVVTAAGAANDASLHAAARGLAARFGEPPAALTIRRTDLAEHLGLAALHIMRGAVVVYCHRDHMLLPESGDALAAILGSTTDALVKAAQAGESVRVTFRLHADMPHALRYSPPLFLEGGAATVRAWDGLLTEELAGALGILWTCMIEYLAQSRGQSPADKPTLRRAGHPA